MKHDFKFISKHSQQVKSAYSDLMEILSLVHEIAKTNNKGDIEKPKPSVKEKFKHDITFVLWLIGLCIYRLSFSSFSSNIAEKLSVYSFIMSNEPMIS